jgi:DNA-binding GntR family transcriptional regulator
VNAAVPALERTTTGSQVERVLREMILDGRLVPGTHLRETQVARSLGVSRNTLREALRSLAEHGLVTHHPHRGVVVTDLTVEDVADLFRLRLVLEQAGLAALVDTAELARATDAFAAALERGDAVEALEEDFRFHRALVAALGSARLAGAHERAQGELRLVLLQLDRDYEPPQVEEHRAILAAVGAGNRDAAAAALAAHLERAAERLIVLIRVRESNPIERSE